MSQRFVDHIETVTVPGRRGVAFCTRTPRSTPYAVSSVNRRSADGQTTVASRPAGIVAECTSAEVCSTSFSPAKNIVLNMAVASGSTPPPASLPRTPSEIA